MDRASPDSPGRASAWFLLIFCVAGLSSASAAEAPSPAAESKDAAAAAAPAAPAETNPLLGLVADLNKKIAEIRQDPALAAAQRDLKVQEAVAELRRFIEGRAWPIEAVVVDLSDTRTAGLRRLVVDLAQLRLGYFTGDVPLADDFVQTAKKGTRIKVPLNLTIAQVGGEMRLASTGFAAGGAISLVPEPPPDKPALPVPLAPINADEPPKPADTTPAAATPADANGLVASTFAKYVKAVVAPDPADDPATQKQEWLVAAKNLDAVLRGHFVVISGTVQGLTVEADAGTALVEIGAPAIKSSQPSVPDVAFENFRLFHILATPDAAGKISKGAAVTIRASLALPVDFFKPIARQPASLVWAPKANCYQDDGKPAMIGYRPLGSFVISPKRGPAVAIKDGATVNIDGTTFQQVPPPAATGPATKTPTRSPIFNIPFMPFR